jgi:hypothetical protein
MQPITARLGFEPPPSAMGYGIADVILIDDIADLRKPRANRHCCSSYGSMPLSGCTTG